MELKFKLGQIVFLKTDREQLGRMVTGILIRPFGVIYYLTYAEVETSHYEIEISDVSDAALTFSSWGGN